MCEIHTWAWGEGKQFWLACYSWLWDSEIDLTTHSTLQALYYASIYKISGQRGLFGALSVLNKSSSRRVFASHVLQKIHWEFMLWIANWALFSIWVNFALTCKWCTHTQTCSPIWILLYDSMIQYVILRVSPDHAPPCEYVISLASDVITEKHVISWTKGVIGSWANNPSTADCRKLPASYHEIDLTPCTWRGSFGFRLSSVFGRMNRQSRGNTRAPTGLTAHVSLRGRPYRGKVCCFGETIWGLDPLQKKFRSQWRKGCWLGKDSMDHGLILVDTHQKQSSEKDRWMLGWIFAVERQSWTVGFEARSWNKRGFKTYATT